MLQHCREALQYPAAISRNTGVAPTALPSPAGGLQRRGPDVPMTATHALHGLDQCHQEWDHKSGRGAHVGCVTFGKGGPFHQIQTKWGCRNRALACGAGLSEEGNRRGKREEAAQPSAFGQEEPGRRKSMQKKGDHESSIRFAQTGATLQCIISRDNISCEKRTRG